MRLRKIAKCILPTSIKNPEKSEQKSQFLQTDNWKSSKRVQIATKLQALSDQKLAIETHMRELELNVVEPPNGGTCKIAIIYPLLTHCSIVWGYSFKRTIIL